MSTEILFDTTERRLINKSAICNKSMINGLEKMETETPPKNENLLTESQGSVQEEIDSSLTQSLNRKIDYHIQLESNEIVIQVLDGETGEVIREIPQQDFIRLVDRVSEFHKTMLDEIA